MQAVKCYEETLSETPGTNLSNVRMANATESYLGQNRRQIVKTYTFLLHLFLHIYT